MIISCYIKSRYDVLYELVEAYLNSLKDEEGYISINKKNVKVHFRELDVVKRICCRILVDNGISKGQIIELGFYKSFEAVYSAISKRGKIIDGKDIGLLAQKFCNDNPLEKIFGC